MSAPLRWLEKLFRQQRDAMACLVISLVPLPLFTVFLFMPLAAQMSEQWSHIYRQERVPFSQVVLVMVMATQLLIARRAWQLRKAEQDLPALSLFAVFTAFSAVIVLSIGYGYKDSPLMLLCMGMLILVRALFKPQIYKPIFIVMGFLFVISEVAFWTDAFPYAPLLQSPIFVGEQLNAWWAFWLRIIYNMITIPVVALFFLIAHIMVREQKELEALVRTDTLTGLLNRRAFMDAFELEMMRFARRRHPLSLMLLDVDHFKQVNDQHGHPAGDKVLEVFGRILADSIRRRGDVAARVGGEEFAVLLPETELAQAERIAEHIAWQLRTQAFGRRDRAFGVTVSIGVVQIAGGTVDDAWRQADDNLYEAKRAGRDQVVASLSPGSAPAASGA